MHMAAHFFPIGIPKLDGSAPTLIWGMLHLSATCVHNYVRKKCLCDRMNVFPG